MMDENINELISEIVSIRNKYVFSFITYDLMLRMMEEIQSSLEKSSAIDFYNIENKDFYFEITLFTNGKKTIFNLAITTEFF